MVVSTELERSIEENGALFEICREPNVSTKLRTAEDFGFESDNYYTAEEKMIMEGKKGGLVSGPFSRWLPAS